MKTGIKANNQVKNSIKFIFSLDMTVLFIGCNSSAKEDHREIKINLILVDFYEIEYKSHATSHARTFLEMNNVYFHGRTSPNIIEGSVSYTKELVNGTN